MMKKILIALIVTVSIASLIAWRVNWTINKAEIEIIENQKQWVNFINETEESKTEVIKYFGCNYSYPTFNVGLKGIYGNWEINVETYKYYKEGNELVYDTVTDKVTFKGHYDWITGTWEGKTTRTSK